MKFKGLLSIFIFLVINSYSQEFDSNTFWLKAGYGFSTAKFSDSEVGLTLNGSFSYKTQNNIFTFSYFNTGEFWSNEYVETFSLQYGKSYDFSMRGLLFPIPLSLLIKKNFNYSIIGRVGFSYNKWNKKTTLIDHSFLNEKYNYELIKGFGFPIELEIKEDITGFLGMGFSIYTNISGVKGYTGFSINLCLGKF